MKRREFIALLGGAAATWPLAARAQQGGKRYIVGLLSAGGGSVQAALNSAFVEGFGSGDGSKGKTSFSKTATRRIGSNGCPNSQQT
jgi:hypothetical protein